ncbi:hypothetical protein [Planctomicrobium sp. SH527]|uniref:hypothetical protein n=1 Tax=Planctomicrobium sp. SH527 TaxID=3448123 RepID=UPI003F5C724A
MKSSFRAVEEGWYKSGGKNIEYMIGPAVDLWSDCANGSLLKRRMCDEGVQFKTQPTEGVDAANSQWIPFMLMALGSRHGPKLHDFNDLYHIVLHAIMRWSDFNEQRQRNIVDQPIVDALSAKYGSGNPFDSFKPGRAAATRELRELISENELPSGEESSWLLSWKAGLEVLIDTDSTLPKPAASLDVPNQWAVLTADSEIKANLTIPLEANEDWKDFIQRVFVEEWVAPVLKMALRANKTSTQGAVWSVRELSDYISATIRGLNACGYELVGVSLADVSELFGIRDDDEPPEVTTLST